MGSARLTAFEVVMGDLAEQEGLGTDDVPRVPPRDFVANFVRMQRAMVGWKQDALASFAGVSLSTVQRIERGQQVCDASLDRVAVALYQKPGAFTEPRIPLHDEKLQHKVEECVTPFNDQLWVPVRPLRTQPQVAELVRTDLSLIDGGRLGEAYDEEIAAFRESLGCVGFILATENENSIVHDDHREPVKRRNLYAMILAYPVNPYIRYMLGASSRRNKARHRSAPLHHRRCRATSGRR
jgi:transcriptional regulator with XRE-family HTH domain